MEAGTIRALARPIILWTFIGGWTVVVIHNAIVWHEPVPMPYWVMACLGGLEWVSERAIKRFKEIFGNVGREG
ncbi:hypothetical protein ES708_03590 [subsurface metagenome]